MSSFTSWGVNRSLGGKRPPLVVQEGKDLSLYGQNNDYHCRMITTAPPISAVQVVEKIANKKFRNSRICIVLEPTELWAPKVRCGTYSCTRQHLPVIEYAEKRPIVARKGFEPLTPRPWNSIFAFLCLFDVWKIFYCVIPQLNFRLSNSVD